MDAKWFIGFAISFIVVFLLVKTIKSRAAQAQERTKAVVDAQNRGEDADALEKDEHHCPFVN